MQKNQRIYASAQTVEQYEERIRNATFNGALPLTFASKQTGAPRLSNSDDERKRLVLIQAFYERGNMLCLHFRPGTRDHKEGQFLRERASILQVRPTDFYDLTPEEWGWRIMGFVPG
ncbi:hypothetical protein UFOVP1349_26 [uncultured Caudovirales phage]|uniref:Uncharacterized protein n=1 Tax=uncultured Caudovirales phage TaxID=2100421 RepID=A0A6J5S128_9CAUD|nr:hypothetical protein UFOVP925_17 [uncultured Caudovirales phage]CAB4184167.1 hypothetical protein UFOVP1097_32 [uncultured Caudovirales phage]CAB4200063.1 hypothetical protein UFOVP1349_26 [uncultured Caudovirales phage]CAB4213958.1 hypothetical protein UFOVP1456_6 [uncultured Caudovirales phage]